MRDSADELCGGRSDVIDFSAIQMPSDGEKGNITVSVARLLETEKGLEELTADDYITIGFYRAWNAGIPRGIFQQADSDRNKYYFEL